ncbi:RND transporter [Thalassobaculum fulvum]|uniref:RND transporter n=1 Tax=Thalassobaculum fulvum TaxID=1633335 RepID=A0A918XWY8_9PROT|nr:efflux RND transporter periplasmic adaptor subunit [Thalassobaculum fulvum]GHD59507.1 RND transporter [Thalassobaculum fulvum]
MTILRSVLVAAVLAAAGAAGYWLYLRPTPVDAVAARRGDAAEIVYATGVVEPRTWAKVTALIRERITWLCNCEGETVVKGAELARLDDREAQAALAELKARLQLAHDELERQSVLAGRNVASQQALDRARSEVAQYEALAAGQVARIESYVLRAPGTGVVLRQDGEVGEIAEPGTVLFWVGRPTPLLVIADVNEEDVPRVEVGQRVLLRSDAFPDRELAAVVDSVTPKGDPVTKTFRVRLRLPDDTPLRIGMSVDVNIVVRVSENTMLIPGLAVEGGAVFVVEDGTARRRTVDVGIRGTRATEILSGLGEGERVITPFPAELADGARVDAGAR